MEPFSTTKLMPVSMSIIDILLENHSAEDSLWVGRVRQTGHWPTDLLA